MDAVIDQYVDGLARMLRGPRHIRDEMVAEARHSLLDAAQSYVDDGLSPGQAAVRAVREFGDHRQIAPAYQAELAAAQGKRAALWIAVVLPAMTLLAPLMWWRIPWSVEGVSEGYWLLTQHYEWASLFAGVVAAVELAGFGWGSRFVGDVVRFTRRAGIGALAFLVLHGAAGATVFAMSLHQWPVAASWPPYLVGLALNTLTFGTAVVLAWRCVSVSRLPDPARA